MILSALLPMMAAAQTVKSPNGNVSQIGRAHV